MAALQSTCFDWQNTRSDPFPDPSKAPPGSIRREFGSTNMVNAAHASDAPENAVRELGIVRVGENTFKQVVEAAYGKL